MSQPAISKDLEPVVDQRLRRLTPDLFRGRSDRVLHLESFQRHLGAMPLTRAETRHIFRQIDEGGGNPLNGEITRDDMTAFVNRRPPRPPVGRPGFRARELPPMPLSARNT